jgi:hypothetical protein
MALKLTAPVEQEFVLERTDKQYGTEGTTVRIRQATQRDHERRAKIYSTLIRRIEENELGNESVSFIQHFSFPELMRIQAMLTVIESNIEDENGKPLFWRGMSDVEFNASWGKLPAIVAIEIHDHVLELNPDWMPQGE